MVNHHSTWKPAVSGLWAALKVTLPCFEVVTDLGFEGRTELPEAHEREQRSMPYVSAAVARRLLQQRLARSPTS